MLHRLVLRSTALLLPGLLAACLSSSVSISGRFSVSPGSWINIHSGGPGLEVHMTNAGEGPLLVRWREAPWGTRRELPVWPGETRVVPAPRNTKFDVTNPGDVETVLVWDTLPEGTEPQAPAEDPDAGG